MKILIRNGRLIDPASGLDKVGDLAIASGRIVSLGSATEFAADRIIDASGLVVAPGLVDLAARLREPGQEHEGMLESELAAAAAGGVTSLVCPPDTDPVLDEPGLVEMLKFRARKLSRCRLFPLGALTRNLKGQTLTEIDVYKRQAVGGATHITGELAEIAQNLREGDRKLTPMGLLAVGPMGAGKTFVIKAFLKEAGLSAVALKNFRSKWVGATEKNLERVLATVKAMGPIAVLIDEGDRSFGNAGGEGGDEGTSSRVIARLKEFMSDTENRGQVLFIMLTNRPDRLDTDIKRPGRMDRKIPFFYCETASERAAVMGAVLRRYDGALAFEVDELVGLCATPVSYTHLDVYKRQQQGRATVAPGGIQVARYREPPGRRRSAARRRVAAAPGQGRLRRSHRATEAHGFAPQRAGCHAGLDAGAAGGAVPDGDDGAAWRQSVADARRVGLQAAPGGRSGGRHRRYARRCLCRRDPDPFEGQRARSAPHGRPASLISLNPITKEARSTMANNAIKMCIRDRCNPSGANCR